MPPNRPADPAIHNGSSCSGTASPAPCESSGPCSRGRNIRLQHRSSGWIARPGEPESPLSAVYDSREYPLPPGFGRRFVPTVGPSYGRAGARTPNVTVPAVASGYQPPCNGNCVPSCNVACHCEVRNWNGDAPRGPMTTADDQSSSSLPRPRPLPLPLSLSSPTSGIFGTAGGRGGGAACCCRGLLLL